MKLSALYTWQVEINDGTVISQYDENRIEQSLKHVNSDMIVRISYIPAIGLLPQHNIVIDKTIGEKFIRRFQRGFIKQQPNGFKLAEYLHCCVTNRYRVYIFSSNGSTLITHRDYDLYV